ncbi:3',5'-cyclic AMP phosphodiesterase CpdA [Hydrogenoanaerobacterium saccharovorans]|uniref:3',5'-cyclic AMP phosphodiesterase CpdA n=1 Tax=Hydrogenoanaerobacterium saccharovorans TaxID=474960 RepID=A0A1H8BKU3_9FIRM|nr:metallophosphoesterase [Hydrogenoanaerobacterium saccharovorans]RPF47387.1 3',5'-cyclic AMP phosphodiesterase CpdA [Hydrogenoanaerobacterium saccharovorans]SEM82678.1 3',5'-cyclic AMP phosphodiesterase CpdA [Hydrogenoanaerobacterium saccharovorans]
MSKLKRAILFVAANILFIITQVVTCVPVLAQEPASPSVRFGVISDVHLNDKSSQDYKEDKNLIKALTKFKQENIDALMVAGDIANSGKKGSYEKFNSIFNQVFDDPATRPQKLMVMGNHDYYGSIFPSLCRSRFKSAFGADINRTIVMNGYSFIGVSTNDRSTEGDFPSSTLNWLKQQIDNAIASDPNKPIFVFSHIPAINTNYMSDGWGNSELRNFLNSYPQVILFAGHTHCPLEDERSIDQTDFTSVATCTLSYTELENGKVNGSVPPRADEVAQGLIVDVTDSTVDIKKWDFHNDEQIKDDWMIDLPISKTDFIYGNTRADSRSAPEFAEGSSITVTNVTQNTASFTVPQGVHDDFVHSYRVKVINQTTNQVTSNQLWFSDFYLGIPQMAPTQTFTVSGLSKGTKYRVEIAAIESFGKESTPLTTTFTTEPTSIEGITPMPDLAKEQYLDSSIPKYFDSGETRTVINFENEGAA